MKNEEILPWLKIISEHLDTIGSELKRVRNLLELKVSPLPKNAFSNKTFKDKPEVIPLDLEAFAANSKDKGPTD